MIIKMEICWDLMDYCVFMHCGIPLFMVVWMRVTRQENDHYGYHNAAIVRQENDHYVYPDVATVAIPKQVSDINSY